MYAVLGSLLSLVGLFVLSTLTLFAAINPQIPFYGTLENSSGTPLDGTYDMVFRFYDAASGGVLLDTSTHTAGNGNAVTVSDGEFAVLLGSGAGNTLDGIDFDTASIYVGLTVEADSEMTPRTRLGAAPYAFNADTVDGYDASSLLRDDAVGSISASAASTLLTITQSGVGDIFNIFDGGTEVFSVVDGGSVGIGTTTPSQEFAVNGDVVITGALYDNAYSAGTNGMVLQSDGSGFNWVSTSSLSIAAAASGVAGAVQFSNGSVLSSDAANFFWNDASNRLGLGTSTPAALLDVYGDFQVGTGSVPVFQVDAGSNQALFTNGNFDTISVSFASDPNTGFWLEGVGDLGIAAGGPFTFFDANFFQNRATAGSFSIRRNNAVGSETDPIYSFYEIGSTGGLGFSNTGMFAPAGGQLAFSASGTEVFRVTNAGFFGIGDTSPAYMFTVGAGDAFGVNSAGMIATQSVASSSLSISNWANGYVMIASTTAAGGFDWVATSTLGIGGGVSTFTGLSDVSIAGLTGSLIPFTNAGGTAIIDSADFAFNDTSDTLTIGNLTLADALIAHTVGATTTLANNTPFAWTFATSSSATPLFRIDTTVGSEAIVVGNGATNVYIGSVGSAADLVFEESSTISGQGGNTITLGESGDTFTVASGVTFGVGTSTDIVAALAIQSTGVNDVLNLFETGGAEIFTVLENGNVGIGDTSPAYLFTVGSGDLFGVNSGGLIATQSVASSSLSISNWANGYVMIASTTAAGGFDWVATSTLGISGGSSLFTDGGATTYLTSLTDAFAVGTTSSSTALVNVWGDMRVGTSSTPTVFVDVSANQLLVSTGVESTPGLAFVGDSNTGLFQPYADAMGFVFGGTEWVTMDTASVYGGLVGSFYMTNGAGTESAPTYAFAGDEDTGLYNPTTNQLGLVASGSEAIRILGDGSIGIGTTSPTSILTIEQSEDNNGLRIYGFDDQADEFAHVRVDNTGQTDISSSNSLSIQSASSFGGSLGSSGETGLTWDAFSQFTITGAASRRPLEIQSGGGTVDMFNVTSNGGSDGDVLTIDQNGFVGISTTSPSQLFSVGGNVLVTGALYDNAYSAGSGGMVLQSTGAGFNWVSTSSLALTAGASGIAGAIQFSDGSALTSDASNLFWNNGTNRLGIGTATPAYGLDVYTDARLTSLVIDSNATSSAAHYIDTLTTGSINGALVVDGIKYTTLQEAVDACPSNGCKIIFADPSINIATTTISKGVHIIFGHGSYTVIGGITFESISGVRVEGSGMSATGSHGGTVLNWSSGSTTPMFTLSDVRDSTFNDFSISANAVATLTSAFYLTNGSGGTVAPTNRTFDRIRINGGTTGLTNGIVWALGAGGDSNNSDDTIRSVHVANYTNAAFRIEHAQSKGHKFYSNTMSGGSSGQYGVESVAGSFDWFGGNGGSNQVADFYLGTPNDAISINGGNFEDSGRLLDTGATSNHHAITITGVRWSDTGLNPDNIAVRYRQRGTLTLIGNLIGALNSNPIEIQVTSSAATLGVAIGNQIKGTLENPFTGSNAEWTLFSNTRGNNVAHIPSAFNTTLSIGTTSSSTMLDVWGDFSVGTSGTSTLFVDTSADQILITDNGFRFVGDTDTGVELPYDGALDFVVNGNARLTLDSVSLYSIVAGGVSITHQGGGALQPTYGFAADDDTGVYRAAADTLGFSTGGVERARFDASGNVSISTTSALARLTVQSTSTNDIFNLFETGGAEVLTVLENGRIGIGTSSPASLLDVWGDFRVGTSGIPALLIETDSSQVAIATSTFVTGSALTVDGIIYASNLLGGGTTLSVDANGNIIRTVSDASFKENVTDITGALDQVLQLRGVRYEWKDKERFGSTTEIGFLAQEVDLILPEVVRKGGDYWSLNIGNMVAVVVEAMQELWEMVVGNQEKIKELENRIETLESALEIEYEPEVDNNEADVGSEAQSQNSLDDTDVDETTASTSDTASTTVVVDDDEVETGTSTDTQSETIIDSGEENEVDDSSSEIVDDETGAADQEEVADTESEVAEESSVPDESDIPDENQEPVIEEPIHETPIEVDESGT